MKKFTFSAVVMMVLIGSVYSQTPEAISYQAVARDASGNLLSNQPVGFRMSILQGSPSGTAVYVESHQKTTNPFGLTTLEIGRGTVVSGNFSTIDWGNDSYYLQTEMDPAGGTSYSLMGTSQFLSVPYAQYAKTAGNGFVSGTSGQTIRNNGTSWGPDNNLFNDGTKIGIGTTLPDNAAKLDVESTTGGMLIPRMTIAERDAITSPAAYLMILNTTTRCFEAYDATTSGWKTIYCFGCSVPATPVAGTHTPSQTHIVWNWNTVPGATGYRWNTINDYGTATDMGAAITKSETGLTYGTGYTRYVWAYNGCGYSTPVTLTQSTLAFSCGDPLTINHVAGAVAPVTKTVTYGTVTNIPGEPSRCWITSNLGADHQATAVNDATEASAGWYWQFNRKQGYKHDGTTRTPSTTWINTISENLDWQTANDPCTIELGNGWRIPTYIEWYNVDASGGWTEWNGPWNSGLKLHAAGYLLGDGSLYYRGSYGYYWSSTQNDANYGWRLSFSSGYSSMGYNTKAYGFSLRCLRDY